MDMKNKFAAVGLLSLLIAGAAHSASLVEGSAEAGKAKSLTCGACHGADGNSVNPMWPNIARQHATYLYKQLVAFKGDPPGQNILRVNPLMSTQVLTLNEQDMRDLAVYFEAQTAAAKAVEDPDTVDSGQQLYRGGDETKGVPACLACHGPTGRGNPAADYPSIRGQYSAYTAKQLRDYASGARKSDGPTKVMREIAQRLSEKDIVELASYIQGLH
jgi:cytochrome c553